MWAGREIVGVWVQVVIHLQTVDPFFTLTLDFACATPSGSFQILDDFSEITLADLSFESWSQR